MARQRGDEKPQAGERKKARPRMTCGKVLLGLVKHKKFDELKQRLLATETLDVMSDTVLEAHDLAGAEPFEAVGCSRCAGSGYRGRVGVYEVMTVSEHIRALVLERASIDVMLGVAVREGMVRLRDDGLAKVREGITSIAEIERMTSSLL